MSPSRIGGPRPPPPSAPTDTSSSSEPSPGYKPASTLGEYLKKNNTRSTSSRASRGNSVRRRTSY